MSILLYHKIEPAVILEDLVPDTLVQLFGCENAEFMCQQPCGEAGRVPCDVVQYLFRESLGQVCTTLDELCALFMERVSQASRDSEDYELLESGLAVDCTAFITTSLRRLGQRC